MRHIPVTLWGTLTHLVTSGKNRANYSRCRNGRSCAVLGNFTKTAIIGTQIARVLVATPIRRISENEMDMNTAAYRIQDGV